MNQQQNQPQVDVTGFVLEKYVEKRKKGIVTYKVEGKKCFLVHKQLDAAHNEIEPLRVEFTKDSARIMTEMMEARLAELQEIAKRHQEAADAFAKEVQAVKKQLSVDVKTIG